jgi:hypothetical protein
MAWKPKYPHPPSSLWFRLRRMKSRMAGAVTQNAGVAMASALFGAALLVIAWELGPWAIGCGIKGNVAVGTGDRIYHVPGQRYYWETRINLLRGERWFCSEASARAAGWRRSRV